MTGFQLTCTDLRSIDSCSNTTSESGCFCSNGNVLDDGVCISHLECPGKISVTIRNPILHGYLSCVLILISNSP